MSLNCLYRKLLALPLVLFLVLCGCMNVTYVGQSYPPTENVKVYSKRSLVPKDCRAIGKAIASGPSERFTKHELFEELKKKAESEGAQGMLITGYELVPDGVEREDQLMNDTPEESGWCPDDDSQDDIDYMESEFDDADCPAGEVATYAREMKALFFRDLNKTAIQDK